MGIRNRWALVALPVVILALHTVLSYIGVIGTGFIGFGEKGEAPSLSAPAVPELPVVWVAELGSEEEKDALLRRVIRKNTEARKRIESYVSKETWSFVQRYVNNDEWPTDLPKEDLHWDAVLQRTCKGNYFLVSRVAHGESVSGTWSTEQDNQAVMNLNYEAVYERSVMNMVMLHDHEPPGIPPIDEVKTFAVSSLGECSTLDYAFEVRHLPLEEFYWNPWPGATWTIEDAELDGEPVYRLIRTDPVPNGQHHTHFVYFDPHRDYLICGYDFFRLGTEHLIETRIQLAYLESAGMWYAASVSSLDDYGNRSTTTMAITELELNPAIDDDVFDIASFELKGDTKMERYGPKGGRPQRYRISGGAWVPIGG